MCAAKVAGGAKLDAALARYLDGSTKTMRAGLLEGSTEPDGTPTALVGFWNEYGTTRTTDTGAVEHVPPRPFMRTTSIDKAARWAKIVGAMLQRNGGDFDAALRAAGEAAVTDIQKTIGDWSNPPNAPSTIAKKGFDGPLRGSAAAPMQHAVAYDIVDGPVTDESA
ncbi:hypothetical protein [Burkholderia glumae]|uniref:hypothetical protein n=1 Tax=Burkholderia glumae TaxID=337 RepID=UPI0001A4B4EF|nr:hypothetical protein [Burkholderia glumae]ACR29217.1 Hypothetical protein bglu_1g21110 [Burkholderia glumae BGR1]UVS95652.1 hypothetical protein EFP19_07640 [Burkholderia glumae]